MRPAGSPAEIVKSTYLATFPTATYSGSESKTRYGWTIGAGAEYALTQNWFLRGEYLYIDLGKFDYTDIHAPAVPVGFTWNTEVQTKAHVARLGADLPLHPLRLVA